MAITQSDRARASWQDPEIRAKRVASLKKGASARLKALWADPEYRAKLCAARKKLHSSKEYRKAQSSRLKAVWAEPEHLAIKKAASIRAWQGNSSRRKKAAQSAKKRWADPVFRAKMLKIHDSQQARANNSERLKARWADTDWHSKMTKVRRTQGANKKYRKANSERLKALWEDPEYRAKMIAARKDSYTHERAVGAAATRKANGNMVSWNKGKTKYTDARLARASKKFAGRIPDYNKYRAWYDGPNGRIQMRSKWEVAYAQYLDRQKVEWRYESKYFYVGPGEWNGERYVPDFYLPKQRKYIEIKGRMNAANAAKYEEFRRRYPTVKWQMLYGPDLKKLGVLDIHGCAILDKH
jgi:hypothetical protein